MSLGKFEASTSNAIINLSKIESAGDINCRSSSGKVTFEEVEANNIDIKTSNGIVDIDKIISKNDINIETSNGQVRFKNIEFKNTLECRSSNASIKGEIKGELSDYSIRSKTSNGNNNLPESTSGGAKAIDIETSNSSIDIKFMGQ